MIVFIYKWLKNAVLGRRKKGIPITLCTLLAAVCARLGVTLGAVSFPMTFHLVLPASTELGPPNPLYIDAFGGRVIKSSDEMESGEF